MSTRLYCVPHAGGTARWFHNWPPAFPPDIQISPLELPGRGRRANIPPATTLRRAAHDIHTTVLADAQADYALFGHSMGALVVYETARLLAASDTPPPRLVVLSGRNPPHRRSPWGRRATALSDDRLLTELATMGAVPTGLSRSMAQRYFLPVLRDDLALIEDYDPGPARPIPAPMLVLAGRSDPLIDHARLHEWSRYAQHPVQPVLFDGGHFFHTHALPAVAATLHAHLQAA
ncbi:thioesterase II family protein [Saccharopolyspora sp. 5N708]|uniref:thioesterase II family protein n=1 Tax=Saccharopolyspora sp. 5N708 TaxID=3457424 RepID=UPI003FD09262